MKKAIELIQQEIEDSVYEPVAGSGTTAMFNSTHKEGYRDGLAKAIELIKTQAAIDVVEGSIMYGKKKPQLEGNNCIITIVYELSMISTMDVEELEKVTQKEVEDIIRNNDVHMTGLLIEVTSR